MQEPAAATTTTMATSRLSSGFPDWVFLDTAARIGHCNNATTAEAKTSTLCPIKVSFEIVDPPGLSRCVVNCPNLIPDSWSAMVIGADGAFVLIRVYVPVRDGKSRLPVTRDVFVYRAGPRAPSLHLVPRPYPLLLEYKTAVGVLAAGDDIVNEYCSVVIPERPHGRTGTYSLQVFCTKTMSWSTKVTRLPTELQQQWYSSGLNEHEPTKVFSIGGGSLAWVDLRHGILMCNVLDEEPELRLIQLPRLMRSNKRGYGERSGLRPCLWPIRDVSFRDGRFSFIEMEYPYERTDDDSDDDTAKPLDFRWRATLFGASISSGQWERCHTVASSELSRSDHGFLHQFPEIWARQRVRKKMRTVLSKDVISSGPILDMYHDDTVYMTSMLFGVQNGWVFAVDTEARKLEKVVPISEEERKSCTNAKLMQCAFSRYLNKEGRNFSTQDLDNPEHIQPTQQGSSQQQSHQQSNEGLCNTSSPAQGMLVSMQEQVQQGQMQQRRPKAITWNQDMYSLIAGRTTQKAQQQLIQQGRAPDYNITIPALLPGPRCLTDASIATDQTTASPLRAAGLGVLIVNTQTNKTQIITVQGSIDNVSSVIMAEAAAMALAARVARALGLQQANYLTDNQLLVNFFNSISLSTPPDRRIQPLTQDFTRSLEGNQIKVYKIEREINITAHSLAKQAHRLLAQPPSSQPVFSCTNPAHVDQCPVKNALASSPESDNGTIRSAELGEEAAEKFGFQPILI